jgi:hypothetical protein
MGTGKSNSRGFTLIAALLIMVLLSGVAAGLLFLVTDESKMAGNDLESNMAYYDAESGMEKLTSDLGALYQASMVPTNLQIQALPTFPPTSAMVGASTFNETITYPLGTNPDGTPKSNWNTISAGSNAGLYAEIVPLSLNVIAKRPSGATSNMTRTVEVALIPVFQFGVFCGYDCSYFAGPNFSFGGRVHTNMNLFLASGSNLVFNDKVQAYGEVITDQLENGRNTAANYGGTTYIPKASGGCPLNSFPPVGANCVALPGAATVPGDASWSGGYPSLAGASNVNFPSISTGTFNGFLTNHLTGASNLQLPFVQNSCTSNPPPCTDPISIVRKPLVGESASGTIGSERLYNKAQIRVLIADDPADLHPERGVAPMDAQDVQLPNTTAYNGGPFAAAKVTLTGGVGSNIGTTESIGFATAGISGWVSPLMDAGATGWATWPLMENFATNPAAVTGPWIRVEYCSTAPCNAPADFVGVTQEWLNLGFGQPFNTPPTCPGFGNAGQPCANSVNNNAILILQQLQPNVPVSAANIVASGNWYPINFYDAREGEMRDTNVPNASLTPTKLQVGYPNTFTYSSCSVNGIMNAVELDVGNLAQWLQGNIGLGTGKNVLYSQENGYVLYYSDHRGMRKDPNSSNGGQTPAGIYSGESGIEDVVNSTQNLTTPIPDGVLEPVSYYSYSPEDVDQNGFLDNWGEKNIGYGFAINTNTAAPLNPYVRLGVTAGATYQNYVDCAGYNVTTNTWLNGTKDQEGMANTVSGARHVLKLVDGGMSAGGQSYLPVMPALASGCVQNAANPTGCGGFTVASENPVYVLGNYNTNGTADTFWAAGVQVPHSAASIIADSVTVLSNQWSDANSLLNPTALGNRSAGNAGQDTYYRMAVSGGKNIPFPIPGWAGVGQDFGTDGGLHNFLRYLENWGNVNLWYDGSLVSMYYAEYDTGIFKCCTVVYSPPSRKYYFDTLFLNPNNLPPATPEFQDVVNLSYHQNFTPQ